MQAIEFVTTQFLRDYNTNIQAVEGMRAHYGVHPHTINAHRAATWVNAQKNRFPARLGTSTLGQHPLHLL